MEQYENRLLLKYLSNDKLVIMGGLLFLGRLSLSLLA